MQIEKAILNLKDTSLSEFPNYEFNIWVQRDESVEYNLHIYSSAEDFELVVEIKTGVVREVIRYGTRMHEDKFTDVKTKLKDWLNRPTLMPGRTGTNYDAAVNEYDACNEI